MASTAHSKQMKNFFFSQNIVLGSSDLSLVVCNSLCNFATGLMVPFSLTASVKYLLQKILKGLDNQNFY